jgi:hypothetical protein
MIYFLSVKMKHSDWLKSLSERAGFLHPARSETQPQSIQRRNSRRFLCSLCPLPRHFHAPRKLLWQMSFVVFSVKSIGKTPYESRKINIFAKLLHRDFVCFVPVYSSFRSVFYIFQLFNFCQPRFENTQLQSEGRFQDLWHSFSHPDLAAGK